MFVCTQLDPAWLSISFLDRSSGAHEEIMLASIFCFWVDLHRHTRRSCLPLFSDWVNLFSTTFLSDSSLLSQMPGAYALIQRFGWDDQSRCFFVPISYHCNVNTRSCRRWSLCLTYTLNGSCVVSLLNFGLASMPFLMNDGSDKPSKCWYSLYVVGRNWENLNSI